MVHDYDIIILGAGTTAFAGARIAAMAGKKVAMIEKSHPGGTCVNWGCIPSKTLIHKAEMYYAARKGMRWGLNLHAGAPDCGTLMPLKAAAVETIRTTHYQHELDSTQGITLIRGHGRFVNPNEIQVKKHLYRASQILIATGGRPRSVDLPGLDTVNHLNSYTAMHLACFPESVTILGGGVIALEMGQMFARFGSRGTILERGPRLLAEFDERLTEQFKHMLQRDGVEIMGELLGGVLLTAEQGSGKILGVQMLCPRAADIIHEATLAVRFGLTVVDITTTVHVYPSISDGFRQATLLNATAQGLV